MVKTYGCVKRLATQHTFHLTHKTMAIKKLSIGDTAVVASFPTSQRLNDMIGNVWEWTRSLHRPYADKAYDGAEAQKDYRGDRVVRGGSWFNVADFARCAYRGRYHPAYRHFSFGFRLVLRSPLL